MLNIALGEGFISIGIGATGIELGAAEVTTAVLGVPGFGRRSRLNEPE